MFLFLVSTLWTKDNRLYTTRPVNCVSKHRTEHEIMNLCLYRSPIRGGVLQSPLHRCLIKGDRLSVLHLDGRRLEGEGVWVWRSSCQRYQGRRRPLLQLSFIRWRVTGEGEDRSFNSIQIIRLLCRKNAQEIVLRTIIFFANFGVSHSFFCSQVPSKHILRRPWHQ